MYTCVGSLLHKKKVRHVSVVSKQSIDFPRHQRSSICGAPLAHCGCNLVCPRPTNSQKTLPQRNVEGMTEAGRAIRAGIENGRFCLLLRRGYWVETRRGAVRFWLRYLPGRLKRSMSAFWCTHETDDFERKMGGNE